MTIPLRWPTTQQVAQALAHPESGRSRWGWQDLTIHAPLSPVLLASADRNRAPRRTTFVDNYDEYLDQVWGVATLERLEASAALAVNPGVEYVNKMDARFGFLPASFLTPDSEGPMSYKPHGVVVLLGHFGATAGLEVETWSCSTSHDVVGGSGDQMPDTIGQAALEAIFDAWAAQIGGASTYGFPKSAWLDGVAYYHRQSNGKSATGVWERYIAPTPVQGGFNSEQPYQLALVVSEDAGGARKGRFGRFYLPAIAAATVNDQIDAATAAQVASGAATALSAVNTALNTATGKTTQLVVASAIGSGTNRAVRSLRVGRVFDTQRRRRRSVAEDYQSVDFQTGP